MRYSASEKYEIIRLVEQSSLSVKQTLLRLGYSPIHILCLVGALCVRGY